MAEYIEREAADKELCGLIREYNRDARGYESSGAFEALSRVRLLPAADVVPVVHGEWILTEYPYGQKTYVCSECRNDDWWHGKYAYGDERFCPNCGADMREATE